MSVYSSISFFPGGTATLEVDETRDGSAIAYRTDAGGVTLFLTDAELAELHRKTGERLHEKSEAERNARLARAGKA